MSGARDDYPRVARWAQPTPLAERTWREMAAALDEIDRLRARVALLEKCMRTCDLQQADRLVAGQTKEAP